MLDGGTIDPDDELSNNLQLESDSQVLKIRKIFTANDDPIIYVINYIPLWVFENILTSEEALQPGATERFIDFFEGICNQRISHFVSSVKAEIFEKIEAPQILTNDGPYTPVLVINETGYNIKDKPIVSSCEYHPGDWMTFRMMRRRGMS